MRGKSALRIALSFVLVSFAMAAPASTLHYGISTAADEELGVTSVRPQGWVEYPPRVYRRAAGANDLATFAQRRGAPGLTRDEVLAMIPTYGAELRPAGCRETDWCMWDLYVAESHLWGLGRLSIEVAVTEIEGIAHVMMLQAQGDDFATLRDAVFTPALAAVRPLEAPIPPGPETPEDAAYPVSEPLVLR